MQQRNLDLSTPVDNDDVFHFADGRPNFNDLARQNGFTYWYASQLMEMLGYQPGNMGPINKAIATCTTLGIDIFDNFVQEKREVEGRAFIDYKLSRFACYLVAMNGDPKKIQVARAQAYFAAIAETFRRYVEEAEDVERILVRDELSQHEKTLTASAKKAGVDGSGFALFQNAGYRGLYNMNLSKLKELKRIPSNRSPLDFMGKTELAANLFRITQTEEKLRVENIQGQRNAERTAEMVGRKVRATMIDISGARPEDLPAAEDIRHVKGALKSSQKEFKKLDNKKS